MEKEHPLVPGNAQEIYNRYLEHYSSARKFLIEMQIKQDVK